MPTPVISALLRQAALRSVAGLVALAATGMASMVGVSSTTQAADKSGPIRSVVELFTSQGCSSCPPADALLKSYIEKDGVLALSFNVDIWDSLGWKDTLATPQFTQRQRAYAQTRGDGQVYTPQTIINGMAHAVGSDRSGIDAGLKSTDPQAKGMRVALNVTGEADGVQIDAPTWAAAGSVPVSATIWLVKFTPRVEVAIRRGENSGRSIAYHNVVRELTSVGMWRGTAAAVKLARSKLDGCTPGTCVVLLQQGGTGSVLGAAWVPPINGT